MPGYRSSSEEFYISRDLQHILIRKANELKGERNRIELRISYWAAGIWKVYKNILQMRARKLWISLCSLLNVGMYGLTSRQNQSGDCKKNSQGREKLRVSLFSKHCSCHKRRILDVNSSCLNQWVLELASRTDLVNMKCTAWSNLFQCKMNCRGLLHCCILSFHKDCSLYLIIIPSPITHKCYNCCL